MGGSNISFKFCQEFSEVGKNKLFHNLINKLKGNKNMILVADGNRGFTIEDFLSKQKQNLDRLGSSVLNTM